MSVDRSVGVGQWGHSKVRCDGSTDGHRCSSEVVGEFRQGILSARANASAVGWSVAQRTQYAPNGSDLRDYCPQHAQAAQPRVGGVSGEAVWLYDDPKTGWHDVSCQCDRHCRYCRLPLEGRQRLYCSASCGRLWRLNIAFDRHMESQVQSPASLAAK